MAKRKTAIGMRSYGIYSHWDSRSKELPKILEFYRFKADAKMADAAHAAGLAATGDNDSDASEKLIQGILALNKWIWDEIHSEILMKKCDLALSLTPEQDALDFLRIA